MSESGCGTSADPFRRLFAVKAISHADDHHLFHLSSFPTDSRLSLRPGRSTCPNCGGTPPTIAFAVIYDANGVGLCSHSHRWEDGLLGGYGDLAQIS